MRPSRYRLKVEARRRAEKDLAAYHRLQQMEEQEGSEFRRVERAARRAGVGSFFEMPEESRPPIKDPDARKRAEAAFAALICTKD